MKKSWHFYALSREIYLSRKSALNSEVDFAILKVPAPAGQSSYPCTIHIQPHNPVDNSVCRLHRANTQSSRSFLTRGSQQSAWKPAEARTSLSSTDVLDDLACNSCCYFLCLIQPQQPKEKCIQLRAKKQS